MSSTSPRQGLSNTLRSTKTRFIAVFAFVILTAVFSASTLTANATAANADTAVTQESGFIASSFNNILSYFGLANPAADKANGCDTAPAGVVACYRGDNDATDANGVNNGEWVGAYAYAEGKVGAGAFSFDGNNRIEVANSFGLNPANITVDGWVNLANARSLFNVASKGDAAYALRVVGQKLQFTSRNAKGEVEILESGELIRANTWVHVAATHDGATRRLYINGYEVASGAQDGLQTTDLGVLSIGHGGDLAPLSGKGKSDESDMSAKAFGALADEVRIFGRALSGDEIKEIGAPEAPQGINFRFTAAAQSVSESGGNVNITITRDTTPAATVDLDFTTTPGTATRGVGSSCSNPNPPGTDDYLSPTAGGSQTLSFALGETSKTIGIEICNDTVPENTETFVATLSNASPGSTVGAPATHTVTILDDDTTLTLTRTPASRLENSGLAIAYTVTRSPNSALAQEVNFTTAGVATRQNGCGAPGDFDVFLGAGANAGTWTNGATPGTATLIFAPNAATATLNLIPCADALVEPDEDAVLTISPGSYVIGNPNTASGLIVNDDFSTIDWTTATVGPAAGLDEGNPGATNSTNFTIVRTQPVGSVLGDLTVRFGLTGSAVCATGTLQDYTVSPGAQVTFDPTTCTGTLTIFGTNVNANFQVNTVSDIRIEADETIIGTILPPQAPLTNANNYVVGATIPTSTALINDDDETITVDATVGGSPISEAGPGGMTFNVNRIFGSNGGPAPAVTDAQSINFSLSALAPTGTQAICTGADYTVSGVGVVYNAGTCTGTIAIPGSVVFATVVVTPVNDSVPESDETVTLTITPNTSGAAGNYGIGAPDANGLPSGTATATGTILNDDIQVIVTVAPSQVLEDGVPNLIYTFTRIGDSASVVTANFTASGSASPLSDYVVIGATTFNTGSGQGTVAFPAGNNTTVGTVNARTFPVTVDPTADTTVEPDEEVQVQVDNGVGYTPGTPNLASGLIINDDTVVTVAVAPASSNEDLGPNMVYTFTRTGNFGVALNVPFTVSGTAIANDYTGTAPGAQVAVFAAGNSTTTVTVDPTADTTVEPDETVIVTLDTPAGGSGYTLGTPSSATGTIVNDDTDVNITLAGSPIFENAAGVMTYTFTRTGLINGNLTVNFSTTGTAASGTDYVQSSTGTVTFTGANTTATVTVDPSPDSDIENDETVILTVLPGTGYNVGATAAQTGTITSDDVDVQLNGTVTNSPVVENGTNNLIYTIQRVGLSTTQEVTVAFTIGGGTNPATCGEDYDVLATAGVTFSNAVGCAGTGTAVIAAGNASTTVTVDPRPDLVVETDETVRVTLNSCAGSGASLNLVNTCDLVAPTSVDGIITNDDTEVNVAVAPPTIVEDAAGVMTYTFTRNTSAALLALPLNVNYNSSGTACGVGPCADTFGVDFTVGLPANSTYNGTNGTGTGATSVVQFAAGSTTAQITVDPTADTSIEADQTVILTIVAGTGYNAVPATAATGTIRDEDSSVQFGSATFSHNPEGTGADTIAMVPVTRNGPGSAIPAAQVDASTIQVGGTATGSNSCLIAGTDYVVVSGQTITWAAGDATPKSLNITVCGDSRDEANETLNSQLSNFIGTQIGSPISSVTTIVDDDNAPSFVLTPALTTVAEGATATYTVTRSGNETQLSTTVTWAATGITATGGTDFSPVTGTVTFAAGTGGTQTFTINAATDLVFEGNETYGVALTAASNGSSFSGTNTTTITDGNTAPTVAINDVTQVELNSGQSAFIFTITRTGDSQANQTMTVSTQDGGGPTTPATAPSDYTAIPGDTVTFTQGQTTRQVAVIVNGDVIFEDDENFRVNLTNFNFGSATRATGIGTITNDDSAPVFNLTATVGEPNESETEGSGAGTTVIRFTITKTGTTELTSIVSASTVNGSAVAPGDFTALLNQAVATFAPGDVTKTFDVTVIRDTIRENTETFTVNLTNVTNGTFGPNTSGTGTIIDDEANPNFVLSAVSASNPEGTAATFLVTMNFPTGLTGTEVSSTLSCSSSVLSSNSTIHAQSNDFSVTSNSINFAAGAANGSTQPCSFSTTNDTVFEGAETFNVALAGSSGAIGTVSGTPQTATIVNNDGCTFVAANFSDTEGNAGTKPFTHNVVKTCDTGNSNAIVGYASSDGTAINPVDYTEIIPGNLNYTPATTSLPLVVSVNGDLTVEPDETYNVLLTGATVNGVAVNAANCGVAVCGLTNGLGTILNDDDVPISITGTITNFGGGPAVGVTVVLSGSTAATTTTNASGVYTFTNLPSGGNFLVTPTAPAGTVASPTTRSYTGIMSSVANANFVLYQSGAIPRTVNVINSFTNPGSPVTVPITLTAQGDEAALSFTLTYNAAILTGPAVACGSGSAGCSLTVNTATPGVITVAVEAQDGGGNPAVYAAGTRVVINVTFNTNVTAAVNTPINFTSVPTQQRVSDSASNPLPTVWNNGFVVFGQGTESDVAPRPSGGSGVDSTDVIQTRRFVTGLDTPNPNFNEFQRADSAPGGTKGDGNLNASDVIQARRYSAGLDLTQSAGGPFVANPPAPAPERVVGGKVGTTDAPSSVGTIIRAGNSTGVPGTQVFVDINLDHVVADRVVAMQTSVQFDNTKLSISGISSPGTNPDVTLGANVPGSTSLTVNGNQVGAGRIGFLADSFPELWAPGTNRQIVRLRFTIAVGAPAGLTPITLISTPVPQSISDDGGNAVTFTNENGSVLITNPPTAAGVTVGGRILTPTGAGLRGATVSITDGNGVVRTVTTSTFGYYQFEEVEAGNNYVVAVASRRYRFSPRLIQVIDNLTDVDFTGQN